MTAKVTGAIAGSRAEDSSSNDPARLDEAQSSARGLSSCCATCAPIEGKLDLLMAALRRGAIGYWTET